MSYWKNTESNNWYMFISSMHCTKDKTRFNNWRMFLSEYVSYRV